MVRYDKRFWVDKNADVEKGVKRGALNSCKAAKSPCEGSLTGSSLTTGLDSSAESSETDEPAPQQHTPSLHTQIDTPPLRSQLLVWALRNPVLLLCWLLTITIGLPLRYRASADIPLATLLLFSTWLTTLSIQAAIKSPQTRLPAWLRTLLSGLLNPVLWTSLAMIAYVSADAALSHRPLPALLATLQSNNTPLSTLILHHTNNNTNNPNNPPTTPITAGDVATTLLTTGLATWGLNLFTHRTRLFSLAGLSTVTVSAVLALFNCTLGPALAGSPRWGLGVAPQGAALAFAARSVTVALAGPVMGLLGGDRGVNAAVVVGSGIVCQMGLGLGVGGWLERGWMGLRLRGVEGDGDGDMDGRRIGGGDGDGDGGGDGRRIRDGCDDGVKGGDGRVLVKKVAVGQPCGEGGAGGTGAGTGTGMETQTQTQTQTQTGGDRHRGEAAAVTVRRRPNHPRVVAAGVTVGINAAAMGTAYLYETQNEAAPYAALSMIALGVMTVVFSSIPPLAAWIVKSVAE